MASRTRKLAAVMFSDIVGYTALMARDEERGLRVRDQHRRLLADRVSAHGGARIDETGDETLSTFDSALDAVACALDIQAALADEAHQATWLARQWLLNALAGVNVSIFYDYVRPDD